MTKRSFNTVEQGTHYELLVYKVEEHYEPEPESFTGEWKYERPISSFDF